MIQAVPPGKLIRAPFLYQDERPIVILPIDDFLLAGPRGGLADRSKLIPNLVEAHPDAVMTFSGALSRYPFAFSRVGRVLNLSASTVLSAHTVKIPVHGIREALRMHASAVAYHINIASSRASDMIQAAGEIICEAQSFHLPVIGIIYPRGERSDGTDDNHIELRESDPEAYADLVAHCVALGVDLGFDAVKTVYTESVETFRRVVSAADGIPVLVAGGPTTDQDTALARARDAMSAGAAGISFGRNVFEREQVNDFVAKLQAIRRIPRGPVDTPPGLRGELAAGVG